MKVLIFTVIAIAVLAFVGLGLEKKSHLQSVPHFISYDVVSENPTAVEWIEKALTEFGTFTHVETGGRSTWRFHVEDYVAVWPKFRLLGKDVGDEKFNDPNFYAFTRKLLKNPCEYTPYKSGSNSAEWRTVLVVETSNLEAVRNCIAHANSIYELWGVKLN